MTTRPRFSRETCDTTARLVRTQHDADLILSVLGLLEQDGHTERNTNGLKSGHTRTVTRRPLWDEPVIGTLREVADKGVEARV